MSLCELFRKCIILVSLYDKYKEGIYSSLHDRRFMSQAGRTRYFARSATRARSARRGEEKNKGAEPGFHRTGFDSRTAEAVFAQILQQSETVLYKKIVRIL